MDDLISRQAAIDALEWKWAGKAAIDAIKNLPSAQPERKKVRWERVSADEYRISASYVYRCADCGEVNWYESCFCPNCGADMRGEEDDS